MRFKGVSGYVMIFFGILIVLFAFFYAVLLVSAGDCPKSFLCSKPVILSGSVTSAPQQLDVPGTVTQEDVEYWSVLRSCRPFSNFYKLCDDGIIRMQSTNYEVMDIHWILSESYSNNKARAMNANLWLERIGELYND